MHRPGFKDPGENRGSATSVPPGFRCGAMEDTVFLSCFSIVKKPMEHVWQIRDSKRFPGRNLLMSPRYGGTPGHPLRWG